MRYKSGTITEFKPFKGIAGFVLKENDSGREEVLVKVIIEEADKHYTFRDSTEGLIGVNEFNEMDLVCTRARKYLENMARCCVV